jgi:hypothetical protein
MPLIGWPQAWQYLPSSAAPQLAQWVAADGGNAGGGAGTGVS